MEAHVLMPRDELFKVASRREECFMVISGALEYVQVSVLFSKTCPDKFPTTLHADVFLSVLLGIQGSTKKLPKCSPRPNYGALCIVLDLPFFVCLTLHVFAGPFTWCPENLKRASRPNSGQ
eukprot:411056-Amphidinium_carterae.1